MASSSFEEVLSGGSELNSTGELTESLIRSTKELGPRGIAEFNKQINQRFEREKAVQLLEFESSRIDSNGFSGDEESYVDVLDEGERKDVLEAKGMADRLGGELHHGKDDNLDMAEARVRRRTILEEDIVKQIEPFKKALGEERLEEIHAIAELAKSTIEEIKKLGENKQTSVVKPTELISDIADAFQKMCQHVTLDTKRIEGSAQTLKEFQDLMEQRLTKLKAIEMEKAEKFLKQSFERLTVSRKSASIEVDAVTELMEGVAKADNISTFKTLRGHVDDTVDGEIKELDQMMAACESDLRRTAKLKEQLAKKHEQCTDSHKRQIASYNRRLEKNQQEQENLRRKLEELRVQEEELERGRNEEESRQENAKEYVGKATESIREEDNKLQRLLSQAKASRQIMDKTRGLATLVFDSAETREQNLLVKLSDRKRQALVEDRQVLMESAVTYKLLGKDHQENVTDARNEIKRLKGELQLKAQRGNKSAVGKIQKELNEQEAILCDEKEKLEEKRREYEALKAQIDEVEKEMDKADPALQTTVEDLLQERSDAIRAFWEQSVAMASLSSMPDGPWSS